MPKQVRYYLALALIIGMGLWMGGCRSKHSSSSNSSTQQGITYTYHLRAIVKALPLPGQSPASISLKTQPIANWVGFNGHVTPMMAMTMPYQLAPGVSLSGIAFGDKVAFTYKVNWTRDRMVITRIQKLPAGTILHFAMPVAKPLP